MKKEKFELTKEDSLIVEQFEAICRNLHMKSMNELPYQTLEKVYKDVTFAGLAATWTELVYLKNIELLLALSGFIEERIKVSLQNYIVLRVTTKDLENPNDLKSLFDFQELVGANLEQAMQGRKFLKALLNLDSEKYENIVSYYDKKIEYLHKQEVVHGTYSKDTLVFIESIEKSYRKKIPLEYYEPLLKDQVENKIQVFEKSIETLTNTLNSCISKVESLKEQKNQSKLAAQAKCQKNKKKKEEKEEKKKNKEEKQKKAPVEEEKLQQEKKKPVKENPKKTNANKVVPKKLIEKAIDESDSAEEFEDNSLYEQQMLLRHIKKPSIQSKGYKKIEYNENDHQIDKKYEAIKFLGGSQE